MVRSLSARADRGVDAREAFHAELDRLEAIEAASNAIVAVACRGEFRGALQSANAAAEFSDRADELNDALEAAWRGLRGAP